MVINYAIFDLYEGFTLFGSCLLPGALIVVLHLIVLHLNFFGIDRKRFLNNLSKLLTLQYMVIQKEIAALN